MQTLCRTEPDIDIDIEIGIGIEIEIEIVMFWMPYRATGAPSGRCWYWRRRVMMFNPSD